MSTERTYVALFMFALCVVMGAILYQRSSADSILTHKQQDTITILNERVGEYVIMINRLYQEKAFMGGQLIEQSNIFKHKCFEVVELLEDHLLKQKQMISQFVLPRREVKE